MSLLSVHQMAVPWPEGWLSGAGELHAVNRAFYELFSQFDTWPVVATRISLTEAAANVPFQWVRCLETSQLQVIVVLPQMPQRSWILSAFADEQKEGRHILFQEITALCSKKGPLEDFHQRMRGIAYEVPVALIAFDAQGIVRAWSRRAEEITGLPAEAVMGQADVWQRLNVEPVWEQKVDPELWPYNHTFFFQRTSLFRKSSGEWLTFSWTARYNTRVLPEASYWFTGVDITKHADAMRALYESEANYRTICRATNDAVWAWDIRTDELRWNHGLYSIFGYRTETIRQHVSWWEGQIHPDDRARVVQRLHDFVARREEIWTEEYRFCRADGSYAEVFDKGSLVLDAHDQPIRMIGGLVDITRLRLYEENLALKNRQITEYTFFNSHHLRAPVARLMGLIYLFNVEDPASPDNRDLMQRILTEVEEMDRLIRNASQLLR